MVEDQGREDILRAVYCRSQCPADDQMPASAGWSLRVVCVLKSSRYAPPFVCPASLFIDEYSTAAARLLKKITDRRVLVQLQQQWCKRARMDQVWCLPVNDSLWVVDSSQSVPPGKPLQSGPCNGTTTSSVALSFRLAAYSKNGCCYWFAAIQETRRSSFSATRL